MKSLILKNLDKVKNLFPYFDFSCQKYGEEFLILKFDHRKSIVSFTFKTKSEKIFLNTLMKESKCSINIAEKILEEILKENVYSTTLNHDLKTLTILELVNIRPDLRNKPIF